MIFEPKTPHCKPSETDDSSRFDLFLVVRIRYESVTSQRQRDKQRLADLERNVNEEKQQRQRLDSQIKTEKTLTKKLQDDLTKLTSAPPR